ncbi:AraC family transcriptional regulator [Kineothrix sp. MB12-C1]|uniref:AraC family transcriptional regulator n=1 Tax=Kineothrix sp. MB12-C1 TaxID=3070215 RepID=UPI0027D2DFC7|nr:AraC family transcriptional regulator [Kineothrix sp. MB12-C1]WMC93542.1 AraC family transcriptional regulator [Kineothrix sp. MB12-C1]
MSYESISLKKEFVIDNIFSIHYFEYMSDFNFPGESHDFWEILYVDKGSVNVTADGQTHTLNKDDIIFHKPNEFHSVHANGVVAPNLAVISFECTSLAMNFFENKILEVSPSGRSLLGNIIKEAYLTFSCRLDDPYSEKLTRNEIHNTPFASEQLIQIYLQQLLIQLVRCNSDSSVSVIPKSSRQRSEDELFYKIISYMEENIGEKLTIQQICKDNLIGRSLLQKLFKYHTSCGIIDYFSMMKINSAKQLIRGRQMNFSQIADTLGYNSIHYFSRQFKNITGMTPTEYQTSIQSISAPPCTED